MFIILSVFFISLAGLSGMILFRRWEIKKGKVLAATSLNEPFFSEQEIKMLVQRCYTCIPREYFLRLLGTMSIHGKDTTQKLVSLIQNSLLHQRIRVCIEAVKGKYKIQHGTRPSSPFIQDILAHKEQIRNNK
ncbi:MAG: hypothetical protein HYT93_05095 [Parcubacteria group bacterium]|nr:hypothetical protein [Parcubacteria group bacterium]